MKKGLTIFIATVLVAKLLADGMLSFFPETTHSIMQNPAIEKIANVFSSNENKNFEIPKSPSIAPKTTKAYLAFKAVPTAPVLLAAAPKKAMRVETPAEEKNRRKKRKKKMEADANKSKVNGPKFTVYKVPNTEGRKTVAVSVSAIVGQTYLLPAKVQKVNPIVTSEVAAKPNVDLNQWAKLLTQNPTSALMKSFLSLYKSKIISAKEYYSVISQMQKSTNKEVRAFAIKGAFTETNADAFQILVHSKYSETDPNLQTLTLERLATYKNVKLLSLLSQSLGSGDVYAKIEASDIVGQITQTLMASPQSISSEVKTTLLTFVSILTPLSKDQSSPVLYAMSTKTLDAIKRVLGLIA